MSVNNALNEQEDEKYPYLHGFDYGRRWLDGLISIIEAYLLSMSSILLTVAGGMSMFAFLTGGLSFQPGSQALNLWALIQTIAVDMQFSIMWYKAAQAWRSKRLFTAIGYALLGTILSIVLFEAYAVPSMESTMQKDFQSTMGSLGFDPKMMVFIRSGVAIMLMVVGATNRTFFIFSSDGKAQHIGNNSSTQVALVSPSQSVKNQSQPIPISQKQVAKKSRWFWPFSGKKKEQKIAPAQEENAQVEIKNVDARASIAPQNLTHLELKNEGVEQGQIDEKAVSPFEEMQNDIVEGSLVSEQDGQEFFENSDRQEFLAGSNDVLGGFEPDEPQTNPPVSEVLAGSDLQEEPYQEPQENPRRTAPEYAGMYTTGSAYNSAPERSKGASAFLSGDYAQEEANTSGRLRAIRGMTLEELYEYPPIVETFKRRDTRKREVDAAYNSGTLLRKRDNSVTRNAVTNWLKERQLTASRN